MEFRLHLLKIMDARIHDNYLDTNGKDQRGNVSWDREKSGNLKMKFEMSAWIIQKLAVRFMSKIISAL